MYNDVSLSVIIPAYNVAEYLRQALQSLRDQIVPPDQIILVNDGSTDNTLEIANLFDFPCDYRIFSTGNRGQGPARNLGIKNSFCEYVYFFDSDDRLSPHFVKQIKSYLNTEHSDILLFSGINFSDLSYRPV